MLDINERLQNLKLDFAKATDVTKLAKAVNSEYEIYEKIFILPDTLDVWIIRVQKGYNEDYEEDPDAWLVERDKVGYEDIEYSEEGDCLPYKGFSELQITKDFSIRWLLENDEFENWDVTQVLSLKEATEMVDGGFGINPEE